MCEGARQQHWLDKNEDKMALPNQIILPRLDNFDLVSEVIYEIYCFKSS